MALGGDVSSLSTTEATAAAKGLSIDYRARLYRNSGQPRGPPPANLRSRHIVQRQRYDLVAKSYMSIMALAMRPFDRARCRPLLSTFRWFGRHAILVSEAALMAIEPGRLRTGAACMASAPSASDGCLACPLLASAAFLFGLSIICEVSTVGTQVPAIPAPDAKVRRTQGRRPASD